MHSQINEKVFRSALASKISYNTKANANMIKQLQGSSIYRIINKNEAQMYIYDSGEDSSAKIIAFRGTNSLNQLINFCNPKSSSFKIRNHSVQIHSHILHLFQCLEKDLSNIICKDPYLMQKKAITFCGHSAGGCIAQVAAAYYADITCGNIHIECHSFGCPKVGDANFVNWFTENVKESIQICNDNDLICSLPFDLNNIYSEIPEKKLIGKNICNPFHSHDMDTYIENINDEISKKLF